jgi:putative phosphotransacetylase
MEINVPIEVSARHIHLSKVDLEKLFGEGYQLKQKSPLSQPSDFAAEEVLDIKIGNKEIKNVRVVGPIREKTQVEISVTDSFSLSINAPIRLSGDIDGSHFVTVVGPKGKVELTEGLIVAQRHIHCATKEAEEFNLRSGQRISVKVGTERSITFHDVEVRIKDNYKFCMHIDTDEGNAAGIDKKTQGKIIL